MSPDTSFYKNVCPGRSFAVKEEARAMRLAGKRLVDIAEHFGVSIPAVSRWMSGASKNVPPAKRSNSYDVDKGVALRLHGLSWTQVGMRTGVSRQRAQMACASDPRLRDARNYSRVVGAEIVR